MLDIQTVNDVFGILSRRGDETVALWQTGGEWKPITAKQMYGKVRALAETLQRWGIKKGDRVALVGENRWEWPVTDYAILSVGAADVPLYQTLTPEQMGFILRDSGSKAILLSNRAQYDKLLKAGELPALEHVAVWDDGQFDNAENYSEIMKRASELEEPNAEFDALVKSVTPEDLASIVYTSGTTGDPKGVSLTHGNLGSNLRHSTEGLNISPGDVSLSYLPLSHALARHQDYAFSALGAVIAYLPKFDDLPKAMKAVRPTVFVAVPRVFEKMRQAVEARLHGFKKTIFNWALKQGAAHRDEIIAGKTPTSPLWKLAHKLAFVKIHEAFGGRARAFISGGAPLGKENTDWFLSMGVRVFEGYGLTETSPVMSRNTFDGYRPGTVGTLLPNIEVRIASDGEIETRGPSVFSGYWQNEEATKKEFTDDGWFKTGDIGKLEDGFLSITDRKKELLKTSGGKYVAPQPIEGKLKVDGLVSSAALIGDNRKFVSVVISPNMKNLEDWAKKNGVSTSDPKALVNDPKVQAAYKEIVNKVNTSLAHHETIKKFGVVPEEWTVDSGELTPSLKLKRRVVVEKYKNMIEGFYGG